MSDSYAPSDGLASAGPTAALLGLRQRAEQRRHLVTQPSERQSPDELQRLVQELQVHQIELEMQYEELLLAQTEVQQARTQYVDLYDFAPVGYVTLSASGVIEQLNLRAARLLGTSRQRLEGRRFALFVAPADRPAFHDLLGQALGAEHTLSSELQLLREDGTPFYGQLEVLRANELPAAAGHAPEPRCRLALVDSTARRQAADALAASEARFRNLFEQSFDGMALVENERYVAANSALLRLLGLPDESQLVGQPLGAFSPPLQPDGRRSALVLREHLRLAQRRGWNRFEWFRPRADGSDQWLEMTAAPVVVGGQALLQLVVRYITGPRAAQQQLQASEERQQLALAASEAGVWMHDFATGLVNGDARTWAILGRPDQREALPFREIEAQLHPADRRELAAVTEQAQATASQSMEVELRLLLPDQPPRYLQVVGRLDAAGGQPRRVNGLLRDITARRTAEQELSYKNRLLDRLLLNLPIVLSQISPDERFLQLAGRGLRRIGLADNALVGRRVTDTFPPLAPAAQQLLAGETMSFVSGLRHEGELVYYQHYGFFDELQQRAVVFSIDVTERERLREETLRQQQQQQQQVLAAILATQKEERRRIAESLHNGLGQLLYATKLALSGPAGAAPGGRALSLLDEAIRATRTISFELTPGVLNDFGLAAALRELVKRLPRQPLPVHLRLHGLGAAPRLPPAVEIAAYRITQELINNVIKHSQATEATLDVTLDPAPAAPARLRLVVHDNGRGFDPAAPAASGGIGLRSIRHRVELLGGRLHLDSRPGHGTTVTVELPERG